MALSMGTLMSWLGRPADPAASGGMSAAAVTIPGEAADQATVLADGGYQGTGLVMPHRRKAGQHRLPDWQEGNNTAHCKARADSPTSTCHSRTAHSPAAVALSAQVPDADVAVPGVTEGVG